MTTTTVTQLIFNVNLLTWKMYFQIRGCSVIINITGEEAQSFLSAVKQDDTDRITIEVSKDLIQIHYIINQ